MVLNIELPVVTFHGEASRVLVRVKKPDSVEFWYAEIRHGVIPLPWLSAWLTSRSARPPARFEGVVLSIGQKGEVLLSIPPEIIDHPMPPPELERILGQPLLPPG